MRSLVLALGLLPFLYGCVTPQTPAPVASVPLPRAEPVFRSEPMPTPDNWLGYALFRDSTLVACYVDRRTEDGTASFRLIATDNGGAAISLMLPRPQTGTPMGSSGGRMIVDGRAIPVSTSVTEVHSREEGLRTQASIALSAAERSAFFRPLAIGSRVQFVVDNIGGARPVATVLLQGSQLAIGQLEECIRRNGQVAGMTLPRPAPAPVRAATTPPTAPSGAQRDAVTTDASGWVEPPSPNAGGASPVAGGFEEPPLTPSAGTAPSGVPPAPAPGGFVEPPRT